MLFIYSHPISPCCVPFNMFIMTQGILYNPLRDQNMDISKHSSHLFKLKWLAYMNSRMKIFLRQHFTFEFLNFTRHIAVSGRRGVFSFSRMIWGLLKVTEIWKWLPEQEHNKRCYFQLGDKAHDKWHVSSKAISPKNALMGFTMNLVSIAFLTEIRNMCHTFVLAEFWNEQRISL